MIEWKMNDTSQYMPCQVAAHGSYKMHVWNGKFGWSSQVYREDGKQSGVTRHHKTEQAAKDYCENDAKWLESQFAKRGAAFEGVK